MALGALATSQSVRPANAVTNNPHFITTTQDLTVFESSYQNFAFYAQNRYWLFYEDYASSLCEGQQGCLFYTSSADGNTWTTPTNVGVHVTDSDWSIVSDGTSAFYARYNETSFDSTCNRALLYGTGALTSAGGIAWQPELVVKSPNATAKYPNEVISVDPNSREVWIGYQQHECVGADVQSPWIIHSNFSPALPSLLSTSFTFAASNATALSSLNFTALATGGFGPFTLHWTFGDGSSGDGPTVTHTYLGVGSFAVSLTAHDSSNPTQASSSNQSIFVPLNPLRATPSLQAPSSTSVEAGSTLTLKVNASDTDKENVSLMLDNKPIGATFVTSGNANVTGVLSWTPTEGQAGRTWALTFNATDISTPSQSVAEQVRIYVAPQWSGDRNLEGSASASTSANWHVEITQLTAGQVYAAYWANRHNLFGRIFDGSNWGAEEQISGVPPDAPLESTDVNSFIFSSGSNVYAIWYDNYTQMLRFAARGALGGWGPDNIGIQPGSNRYSMPFTATFDQVDSQFYVFWYNAGPTGGTITEWSNSLSQPGIWIRTDLAFNTAPAQGEYTLGSFHYSTTVNGKQTSGLFWVDKTSQPYNLNFALVTREPSNLSSKDSSWNAKVNCVASVVTIEQVLGTVPSSLGGATEGGSLFNPGILAPSPGDAKRWLTPGPNVPPGWQTPGPGCTITNADGQIVSAFVEIRGVERGFMLNEDLAVHYDPVNGGSPYSNVKAYNDTTFNIFTPGFNSGSGLACFTNSTYSNTSGCLHTIHVEFDHDWKAAGYCGLNTTCSDYQLATHSQAGSTLLDFQGFIYWDPDHTNDPSHSFSGWELHPLTAWRLESPSDYALAATPNTLTLLPGTSAISNITVNSFNLFSDKVLLNATILPLDSSTPKLTIIPSTVNVTACNNCVTAFARLNITTLPSSHGVYTITVTGHNGTLNGKIAHPVGISLIVQGFTISANPQALSVPAGQTVTSTITLTSVSGFAGNVNVTKSVTGCGCLLTQLSASNVVLGPGQRANVTLTISAGSQVGRENITVTGISQSPFFSMNTVVSATGVDFSLNPSKPVILLFAGSSNSTNIDLASIDGFSGQISLGVTTNSTNVSSFLSSPSVSLTASGPGSSIFVVLTMNGTRPGNYLVTITATSGALAHQTIVTVRIIDFSIASVQSIQVNTGTSGTATIGFASLNGFAGTISLTNATSPSGIIITLSSRTILLSPNSVGSVILSVSGNTLANYTLTITATSGTLIHTIHITINIVDFSISAGSVTPASVNVGSLGNATITLSGLNGFSRTVTLTFSASSGLVCSLSTAMVSLPPSPVTELLSCGSSIANNYTVTVIGTNGTLTHSTTSIIFHIVDFTITPNLSSQSLVVGQSTTISAHLVGLNNFAGVVSLNAVISAPGPAVTFSLNPLKVTPIGNSTVLTIFSGQFAGVYQLNITATNGLLIHWAMITLTVSPDSPNLTTTLSSSSIVVGGSVTDSAKLSGATNTAGGTVTYYLFFNGACGAPGNTVSRVTVSNAAIPGSRSVVLNATGTFSFNATYSGDQNNNKASSLCEPLTVQKANPTISTNLTPNTIQVGQSTIDTATLSTSFQATGSITYNLFTGSNSCSGTGSAISSVAAANSTVPNSRAVTFNSTNSNGYSFQAVYSGDSNNNPATSTCEPLTVNPVGGVAIGTNLSQIAIVVGNTDFDSATLTGTTTTASGTVTYQLFTSTTCTGTGSAVSQVSVSNSAVPNSRSVTFNATGPYGWKANYSGDANNAPATSSCEPLTINKASPTILTTLSQSSTLVGGSVSDSATLPAGYTAGGSVTYEFFTSSTCAGTATSVGSPVAVTNGVVPNSIAQTFNLAGNYGWNAVYSGDSNNLGAMSTCEPLSLNKASPTLATTVSNSTPVVGTAVSDSSTMTNGFNAGGTVTYVAFTNGACAQPNATISSVTVTAGSVPNSRSFFFNSTGAYSLQSSYSGDVNNNPALSPCEPLSVQKASPTISTVLSPSLIQVGQSVTDSATLSAFYKASGSTSYNLFIGSGSCVGTSSIVSNVTVTAGAIPSSRSVLFNTTNSGGYSFSAVYSGDSNNNGATSPCESLVVNPSSTVAITTALSSPSIVVGNTVAESATMTGTTANAGGTVTYLLFASNTCTQTSNTISTVTVANTVVPNSRAILFNLTGSYGFEAVYSGDSNNVGATSACGPLMVNKATPTISTTLSATTITVGGSVTDSSMLSVGYRAGGTVTYAIFTGVMCAGSGTIVSTAPVSNGVIPNSSSVSPAPAGSYSFEASYSGDVNNNGASSACEPLTVNKTNPTIATTLSSGSIMVGQSSTDSAVLTGSFSSVGTVSYALFITNNACTGGSTTVSIVNVAAGVIPNSRAVSFNATGPYSFQAIYSGDPNNNVATSLCEPLAVSKATPSITTALSSNSVTVGGSVFDTSTLAASFQAGGSVTYSFFSDGACTTPGTIASTVTVSNGLVPSSRTVTFNSTGTYGFLAVYSGDSNNSGGTAPCEPLSVGKTGISVSTTLSPNTILVGGSVSDSATVTGGFAPTGTITFKVYSGVACTNSPVATKTVALLSGSAGPVSLLFNSTGNYNWQATYNGDNNNNPASSLCGSESLSVSKVAPTVSTSLSSTSIIVGSAASDTATVTGFAPTGTVTYKVYSGTACSGTLIAGQTVNLSGTSAGPVSVILNSTGIYNWQATYNGDGNNTIASNACGSEVLSVIKFVPTTSTTLSNNSVIVGASVTDTATVSGFSPTGTVTFNIYSGTVCSGTPFDSRVVALSTSGSAGPVSEPFNTVGTYNWQVLYSGDANNAVTFSTCGSETLTVAKANPTVSTTLTLSSITVGNSVSDAATVSGGFGATGTVTFKVYSGAGCIATPVASITMILTGVNAGPATVVFNATGIYNWQAAYSGDLNNNIATNPCGSESITVLKTATSVSTTLSTASAPVGTAVTDSAIVSGFNPTGTVAFSVYSGVSCSGTPIATRTMALTIATTNPISVIFNASGIYNWQAAYGGDNNNLGASSPCGSETLNVLKITPNLSTSLSVTSIVVGNPASDTGTLTGFNPSGSVTFNVYPNNVCSGTVLVSRTVGVASSSAGPITVVFNSTGIFNWQATYNGDSNNNQVSSTCGNETLTVTKITPTITTQLSTTSVTVGGSSRDTATISAGFNPSGSIVFSVYAGSLCTTPPIATRTASVSISSAGTVSVPFNSTGTYSWQASYSGDTNNNPATSACGSETLLVTRTLPTLSTSLSANTIVVGNSVTDSASIIAAFDPTGTVAFSVYSGALCSGSPVASRTLSVSGLTVGPVNVIFNATGTYNWQAGYSGDSNNSPAASACNTENLSVTKSSPAISTTLSTSSIVVGNSVTDNATVTGGFGASGTVTFNVYPGNLCSGAVFDSKVIALSTSGIAGPANVFFGVSSSYNWQAIYSGDSNNNAVTSVCGSETLTVSKASPSASTTLSVSSIVVGNSVSDGATVSGGFGPTGIVRFALYLGNVCNGAPIFAITVSLVGINAGPVAVVINSTGTFNWQATYSGDANNNVAASSCGSETLTTTKASPVVTTSLSSNSIVVGNQASDTAIVTGGFQFQSAGAVTFSVYSGTSCSGTPIASRTVPVSGTGAGPVSVIFNSTGTFTWQAAYAGDGNNNAASSNCGSENLTVNNATPSVTTTLSRNTIGANNAASDTATINGGFNPSGTVTFNVYSGSSCVGPPISSNTADLVSGKAGPVSVRFTIPGTYNWQAVYNGDPNNSIALSACGSETLSVGGALTVSISLSATSVTVGNSVSATSSVTGGVTPSGTVTFNAYAGSCAGTPLMSRTLSLISGSAGPVSVRFNATGGYSWQATYNGDSNNNSASSSCEPLTVSKAAPSVSTTLSTTSIIVGNSASDTAAISSGFGPTGTVTFNVYSGTGCSGIPIASPIVALSTLGTAGPVIVPFIVSGSYDWQVSYSGDANNAASLSPCGSETLIVNKASATISTTLSVLSVTVGGSVSDTAGVAGGFGPTGTVTFTVYSGSACSGTSVASGSLPLFGGSAGPLSIIFNSTGTFNWQANYGGDQNNKAVSSTCGSETVTVTKSNPAVSTTLSLTQVVVGNSVTDSAAIAGGFNPTGTITFDVYSGTTCSGTLLGSQPVALSISGSAGPVSQTFASAGTYNWQAVYSGDSNNSPASSLCGSETVTVTKSSPTLITSLSTFTVVVGGYVTDTAVTIGGFGPTGIVTFDVFTGSLCSGPAIAAKTVNLASNSAGPISVRFNSTGTFTWQATYSGDANNNGVSSACAGETLIVTKSTPSLTTTLSTNSIIVGANANDIALISGGFGPAGTITFIVYSDPICVTSPLTTKTLILAGATSGPASVTFNSTGTFNWQATYNGDNNNNVVQSSCGSETLIVAKASPALNTILASTAINAGGSTADSANFIGSFNPTGIMTFSVYSGASCASIPVATKALPISGNSVGPFTVTFNASGTYNFQASYSGDSNNSPAASVCGSETLAVTKVTPVVSTTLSSTRVTVGNSVSDTATVSGLNPTGSVTFNVYSGTACSGTPVDTRSFQLSASGSAGPSSFTFNTAGGYTWQASYAGDNNNNVAISPCGSETLTVTTIAPTVATTLSANSIVVGTAVTDSATVTGGFNPTGTVTFNVYSGASCAGQLLATKSLAVISSTAGPATVVFNSTGTYTWQAVYGGDSKNGGASSTCGSETLTVSKSTVTITTNLSSTTVMVGDSVSDTATISGGFSPTGTLTFSVYTTPDCSGPPIGSPTSTIVSGSQAQASVAFNGTGSYYWIVAYSGDVNNNFASTNCGIEILTVAKDTPTINTHLSSTTIMIGSSVTDLANLSNGYQITGTVSFSAYSASTCTGTPVSSRTVSVAANGAGSASITFTSSGTFYWQAAYSGDANNGVASSVCGSEILTVAKSSVAISLTVPSTTLNVGNSISVSATIAGGFQPGGTVYYEYVSGTACPGTSPKAIGTQETISNGIASYSSAQAFNSVGTYQLFAIYNGDQNNLGGTSNCQSLTVVPLLSSISPITVTAGSAVRFTVNATDPDTSQVVTLTPSNLPPGATFSSAQSFTDGTTSSVFTWTPSVNLGPGVYNITFTATVGSVSTTTQAIIHVTQHVRAPSLPIVSYSIFGIIGFAAVITAAVLLRRYQKPKRK